MKAIINFFTSKDTSTKAKRVLFLIGGTLAVCYLTAIIMIGIHFVNRYNARVERSDKALAMMQAALIGDSASATIPDVFRDEDLEFAADKKLDAIYRVEFLDVGAADCTLITNGKDSMLVDTGDYLDGDMIVKYLHSSDILSLSTILCTNENPEHIGGLYSILSNLDVETLIIPSLETDNEALQSCIDLATDLGVQVLPAKAYEAWDIGEAQCQILSAKENVISRVTIGNYAFLLMSDATAAEEKALLSLEIDITADFLKAANHGAEGTSYDDFLRAIEVGTCVVSCDEDIAKPHIKTMNRLYKRGCTLRTDENDSVIVITDGMHYRLTSEWTNCDGTYDYN